MTNIIEIIKAFLLKVGLLKYLRPYVKLPIAFLKSRIFKITSKQTMEKLHLSLTDLNVDYWLEFGTLLGAYRSNSFIPHDDDIDIATFDHNRELMEEALKKNGFNKVREIRLKSTGVIAEQTFSNSLTNIDIFYVFHFNDKYHTYDFGSTEELTWKATIDQFGGLLTYVNEMTPFELKKVKFLGLDFSIPKETQMHLKELYGEDFMTPIANWNLGLRPIRKKINDFGLLSK